MALLVASLVLVACGDPTATPVPATTAAIPPTTAPAATTAAAATAAATTAAAAGATTAAAGATTAAAGAAPAPTAPLPTMSAPGPEAGRQVFAARCTGCHFQQGQAVGGCGPNLSVSKNAIDPDFVRKQVRGGKGIMPAFDQTRVSDADLENIILYLKAINKG